MNVLQIPISDFSNIKGGIDKMASTLVNELISKHKITVFVPGDWQDNKLSSWTHNCTKFYKLRLRMPFEENRTIINFTIWLFEFPKALLILKKICRNNNIDIIHAHMGVRHQFYFAALRLLGGPKYLLTLHGSDVNEFHVNNFINKLLVKIGVAGSERINTVSKSLSDNAHNVFGSTPPYIHNGLNVAEVEQIVTAFGSVKRCLPEQYFVIVGSFDPYKGHDIAIKAWQSVTQQHPSIHLVIIGEGILKPDYLALIEQLKLEDRIHLLGQLDHKEALAIVAGAIGMVVPSRKEGLGYVLLEAGALSVPLIVSDIPPFREIIETDGRDGLIFEMENHQELAKKITKLANNSDLKKILASNIHKIVCNKYSSRVMAKNYLALYKSCINP